MMFSTKETKKRTKKLLLVSLIVFLSFLLVFDSTLALQDVNHSDQKAPGTPQKYRIVVKLNDETASQAETSISQKDMAIQKSSPKGLGNLFDRYKIKKIEPVYKELVSWKKKTGKTERDFIQEARKDFPKRSERSPKVQKTTDISNTYVIEADVTSQEEYESLLESLKKDARFKYAEPEMFATTQMVPNDPYFSSRGTWSQAFDDLYGVKITSCPEAWDTAKGRGITVAVVDTGVDNSHPDIAANIWTNTKEIAGNGIDDDNNGYIDDTWGWDFANGDSSPADDHGHGTHVAGTIAAAGNNGIGIIGVAPEARIMPIKALDSDGGGYDTALASAIIYAARNGADVINNSWGGKGYSQVIKEAVDIANELGAVVIAAAGNNDSDAGVFFPGGLENVITAAAIDHTDQKAEFSNWGSCVEVAAPGVDILSLRAAGTSRGTPVGGQYTVLSGTSMAAPHVAGAAALILSHHPEFSNNQVSAVLQSSATDIMSPGFDYATGYGRINAAKALQISSTMISDIESPSSGSSVAGMVVITGSAKGDSFSGYTLEYGKINGAGRESTQWNTIAQGSTPVDAGQLGVFDTTTLPDGKYVLRLGVKDNSIPSNIYFDRVEVEVDQIKISNPAASPDPSYASQIKPGAVVPIRGSAEGQTFQRYRMEWAEGLEPTEWSTRGFTLENGGNAPVTEGLLGSWDSGVYPGRAGYYQLRLLVDNAGFTNEERTIVYLEPDLASANWPQKLESPFPDYSSILPAYSWTGQADLVGVYSYVHDQTSFVKYSYDGVLQYSSLFNSLAYSQAAVGDVDEYPGEEAVFVKDGRVRVLRNDNSYVEFSLESQYNFSSNPVVLQDLDGDSVPEILVLGTHLNSKTRYLYAFKSDGSLLSSKFPIPIPDTLISYSKFVHFLILDMNNDGEKEIITQQNNSNLASSLKLYKWDGTPLAWQAVEPSFSNAFIKSMMGGDLDHDGQEEIILWAGGYKAGDEQRLYVIASDGSVKVGWPYILPVNYGVDGYDLAIADMDRDGTDEIVYSQLNEINVLKMDGKPLSSAWPYYRTRYYGRISVGDINSDGFPEILTYRYDNKKYSSYPDSEQRNYVEGELLAIDRNAQGVKKWKILGPGGTKADYSNSDPVLGDFDNNGKVDIAICLELIDENNAVKDGALTVLTTDGNYDAANMDWPVRLHDPQNSSVHIAGKPLPDITGVSINKTATSITAGQKERLTAVVEPAGANKSVIWSVYGESTPDVAVVGQDGTVTAKYPGTAVIRATSRADSSKFGECTVTVTEALRGVLLSEGFESGSGIIPEGWSTQNVSGAFGEWRVVSSGTKPTLDSPKSGARMIKFNSRDVWGQNTRLYRTSGINLKDGSYSLGFWMYHDNEIVNADCIQVQVSIDGLNWENVGDEISRHDRTAGWKEHTISLEEYKNTSDLRIAFLAISKGGNNMYLDDISIIDTSEDVPVTGISLNKASAGIAVGQTEQLTATVTPANATNKDVTWTVQGTGNVVTVSSTGLVTANNSGMAVIRATSAADPAKYAECTVTVTPAVVPITGISLNKTSLSLTVGQTERLTATVTPQNATESVMWFTLGNVVTWEWGLITAKNPGTTVVRVSSQRNPGIYAECTITVTPAAVPVTGVSLDKPSATLTVGQTEQLTATVTPVNATNKDVTWTVQSQSGSNVVTVSTTGLVTANNSGTAVIRVTSDADPTKYAECTVTVNAGVVPVTGVSLNKSITSMEAGQTEQLVATVTPEDATNKNVTWTISYDAMGNTVTVSQTGLVTANKFGHAVVKVTSDADPSKYATCSVSVSSSTVVPVTGVSINKASVSLTAGQAEQLTATVTPANATNKDVTWTVQGTGNVVTVSSTGLVTANNPGTAVIRATSAADPTKYAECTVTVNAGVVPVTGARLNVTSLTLAVGQTYQLIGTIMPENATDKRYGWSVSGNTVTVSFSGLVTAMNPGTRVIRFFSQVDPTKYAECTVTVTAP